MPFIRPAFAIALLGAVVGFVGPLMAQRLAPVPAQVAQAHQPVPPGAPPTDGNGTPPASNTDDMYGPNPLAEPDTPPGADREPADSGGLPADSNAVRTDREALAANVEPAPPNEAPRRVLPFEEDSFANPLFQATQTQFEQAENLPETAELPTLLTPPEDLPALSIIPTLHLGPLTANLGVRYIAQYDDNILLAEKAVDGDFEHIIIPRLSLSLGDAVTHETNEHAAVVGSNFLTVLYQPQLLFFQHYGEFNTLNQDLQMRGEYSLSKTVIKEAFTYSHSSDPDREIQGRLSRDVIADETDAIYQASDRIAYELDGTALIRDYAQEIDSDEGRLRFATRYTVDPALTVSGGVAGGTVLPERGASQVYEQVSVAAAAHIGLGLAAFLSIGGDFREPDNTNDVLSTPIFSADIAYAPSTETRFELLANRQIFSSPDFIDQNYIATNVNLKATQRLWQTYQVAVEIGYENAEYYQFGTSASENRSDNYPTARVEFNYARFEDLEAGVFYELRKNFSSQPGLSFSDQQAGVQFRIGY